MKISTFYQANVLNLQEVLIALSICAVTNPVVASALEMLPQLQNMDAHASYIVQNGDLKTLKNLRINLTCEDQLYQI